MIPKGADINAGKTVATIGEDRLKDEDKALTHTDVVDRETGDDFWNVYTVERCSV